MSNSSAFGLGFVGLVVASAWVNPLLWITLLVTLWRRWSLQKAAGFGAAAAVTWGLFMYSMQRRIAPEIMATDDEWVLRVVLMAALSMIWISLITYVVRLVWGWSKSTVTHIRRQGRTTYDQVRRNAPEIIERATSRYHAHIGTNTEADDDAFEIAGKELRINRPIESVWARALMLADGDQEKAKSKYIKLRVDQITKLRKAANP